jgi:hypothetical protein
VGGSVSLPEAIGTTEYCSLTTNLRERPFYPLPIPLPFLIGWRLRLGTGQRVECQWTCAPLLRQVNAPGQASLIPPACRPCAGLRVPWFRARGGSWATATSIIRQPVVFAMIEKEPSPLSLRAFGELGGSSHSGRSMRHAATLFAMAAPELIAKGKTVAARILNAHHTF